MAQGISRQVERAQLILDALDHETWTTAKELANLVGVGRQAVTPYIQSLRKLGHPIESARGKGHRLSGPISQGHLLLDQDELYVLFLSLSRSTSDFPENVVDRLKRRLMGLMSTQRQKEAKNLRVGTSAESSFFQDLEILRALQVGIDKKQTVRLTYQGLKDTEPRCRKVFPLEFVPQREWWYLVCWDLENESEKHFRIDRIASAVPLGDEFEYPQNFRRASMHPWDFGSDDTQARILLRPDLARWLIESPAHPSQEIAENDDGSFIATYRVASNGKFLDWLMGLRGFRLLGSEVLLAAMCERARGILEDCGTFETPWEIGRESGAGRSDSHQRMGVTRGSRYT